MCYGILDVHVQSQEKVLRICTDTINNNVKIERTLENLYQGHQRDSEARQSCHLSRSLTWARLPWTRPTHTHPPTHARTHSLSHTNTYSTHTFACDTCVCVCVRACVRVCVRACVPVCVCVCVCTHTHIGERHRRDLANVHTHADAICRVHHEKVEAHFIARSFPEASCLASCLCVVDTVGSEAKT